MKQREYTLHEVKEQHDIDLYWQLFYKYITTDILPNSTFEPSTREDYDYFLSEEYRDTITRLNERHGLKIVFLKRKCEKECQKCDKGDGHNNEVIGFAVYIIYHNEDGKCFILEYGILPKHRSKGIGAIFFEALREKVIGEGGAYFALTVSNEANERFWLKQGFNKTDDLESDKPVYKKIPI